MSTFATVTSKGQITLPVVLRRQLGLQEGDQVEFVSDGTITTLKRVPSEENPFEKWAGRLGGSSTLHDAVLWQRELRDEN